MTSSDLTQRFRLPFPLTPPFVDESNEGNRPDVSGILHVLRKIKNLRDDDYKHDSPARLRPHIADVLPAIDVDAARSGLTMRAQQEDAPPVVTRPLPRVDNGALEQQSRDAEKLDAPAPFIRLATSRQQDELGDAPPPPVTRPKPLNQIAPTMNVDELNELGSTPAPSVSRRILPPPDNAPDEVHEAYARLRDLQQNPAKDKNGRLRSMLIGFLRGLGTSGLGGGIFGAISHVIKPSLDERAARPGEVETAKERLKTAIGVRDADMAYRTALAKLNNAPQDLAAEAAKVEMSELQSRLRAMGGTYTAGRDKRLDDLVTKLGVSPKRGGGGFNPQRFKTVGQDLVYLDIVDGQTEPVVIYTARRMDEGERQRNAIMLEQLNLRRADDGLPPLTFSQEGDAPPSSQTTPAAVRKDSLPPVQKPTSSTPAPAASPLLVPSGKAPEPVRRRSYGGFRAAAAAGGGGSSSSSASRDAKYANAQIVSLIRDHEEAIAQAAASARRGDDQAARDNLRRANELARAASANPNFKGRVAVSSETDQAGRVWTHIGMNQGSTSRPVATTRKRSRPANDPQGLFEDNK
jgi:hypothetical protein